MSNYPGTTDSFRTIENIPGQTYDVDKTTTVYAEDIQALGDAIVAIEETLGTNVEGNADDVDQRIGEIEIGVYKEITRQTLGVKGDTIICSGLDNYKFIRVEINTVAIDGVLNCYIEFNSNTGAKYRSTYQVSASPATATDSGGVANIPVESSTTEVGMPSRTTIEFANITTGTYILGRLTNTHVSNSSGATTWLESYWRYVHDGTLIDTIAIINSGAGNFAAGSEMVVYGKN